MQTLPGPIWGARIEGKQHDIEDWERALEKPFDPWVERVELGSTMLVLLRSQAFESLSTTSEVRERAIPLIERLNGALMLSFNCERVKFSGLARTEQDAPPTLHVFAEAHINLSRTRVVAVGLALGPDGQPLPPPPPRMSAPQAWSATADTNDDVADLLAHFGRANNWYDIYKTIELAEALAGGEYALHSLVGIQGKRLKSIKATANFYRHARPSYRPKIFESINESRPVLAWVLREVMNYATVSRPT